MCNFSPLRLFAALLILSFLVSSCSAEPSAEVNIWIDAPRPGGRVSLGEVVYIQTHAYARAGVVQVELKVDGVDISRESPTPAGGDLVTLTQTWQASAPGVHSLQVAAYASTGAVSSPRVVTIEVLPQKVTPTTPETGPAVGMHEITTTPPPPTLTPTTTATPVTPTPTDAPVSIPPPSILFNVDAETIIAGQCTFLRWQVENADQVTLDGAAVRDLDARQVCPIQTTAYTLQAVSAGGESTRSLTVQVSVAPPQDTTGPTISNLTATPGEIFDNPACGPDRAQITASVNDSGSGVSRVEIVFQAVRSPSGGKGILYGQQITLRMNGTGGQGYSIVLGPSELAQSMALYGGTTIRYHLVARDNAGNTSQSGTASFIAKTCIF